MTYEREEGIENYFRDQAGRYKLDQRKLQWPGRRHAPDRVLLIQPGRTVFVELKAPAGVLRSGQVREHTRLRQLGFQVEVLYTKPQVDEFFRTLWM